MIKSNVLIDFDGTTFNDVIHYRSQLQKDSTAFRFITDENNRQEITYGELEQKSKAIAAELQKLNLAGERALLLYQPGLDYICGFIGCLYAGVIAVPAYPPNPTNLNKTLPRVESIVKDAKIKVALTTSKVAQLLKYSRLHDRLAGYNSEVTGIEKLLWITTDTTEPGLADDWKKPLIGEEDTAFLQYTSGSTGDPKGVMVSHRNLLSNASLIKKSFNVDSQSTEVILWLPFYHDMGLIGGIIVPIYSGITSNLMPTLAFLSSPNRWLQQISSIRDKRVISGAPNFAYDLCIRRISEAQIEKLDLNGWECAFSGAEPVRYSTIKNFSEKFKPCGFKEEAFFPCYGMAETTLFISAGKYSEKPEVRNYDKEALKDGKAIRKTEDGSGENTVLVGNGTENCGMQIITADPVNYSRKQEREIGEIWVKGKSVAKGYWMKDVVNCEIFNAFTSEGEGPFLRTGDLGFIDEGELFITGRLKDVIIIRGKNHYPQDIEFTTENSHPDLRPSCVAAFSVEHESEEKLVIVQEVSNGTKSNFNEIINEIRKAIILFHELQAFAIVLIRAKTIQKTSSGKIKRSAIKEDYLKGNLDIIAESCLDQEVMYSDSSFDNDNIDEIFNKLKNKPNKKVLELWLIESLSRLLRIKKREISSKQSIISMGVDSLLLIEFKNEIEEKLSVTINYEDLYTCKDIAEFAGVIYNKLGSGEKDDDHVLIPNEKNYSEDILTPVQKSMWLMDKLSNGSGAYNVFFAAKIKGTYEHKKLEESINMLAQRHSELRSRFYEKEGVPKKDFHEKSSTYLEVIDVLDPDKGELYNTISAEAHKGFNLESDLLFKVLLFRTSRGEHIILFRFHHIIIDLWSIIVLIDEFNNIYNSINRGDELKLSASDYQFYDYSYWLKNNIENKKWDFHLNYWSNKLVEPLPVLNLPYDFIRPLSKSFKGDTVYLKTGGELKRKIKNTAAKRGLTVYTMLFGAYNLLLHKYSRDSKIIVGTPAANRNTKETEKIVGCMINTLPILSEINGGEKISEYYRRLQKTLWEALEHQEYPFQLLVEKLSPQREGSRSPYFDVMFTMERAHLLKGNNISDFIISDSHSLIDLGELKLETYKIKPKYSQFDIGLIVSESSETFSFAFQFSTDLFEEATISKFGENYIQLLEFIVENEDIRIKDIILADKKNDNELIAKKDIFIKNLLVNDLFERAVNIHKGRSAVSSREGEVTYGELGRNVNATYYKLIKSGIKLETPVGIFMDRSVEMIAALFAVFKSGGIYVPLDINYPTERIKFILADAGITNVITKSKYVEKLSGLHLHIILIESDWMQEEGIDFESEALQPAISGDNAAYIIYTSGSTGEPKGVLIQHNAIANHCFYIRNYYGYTESDRMLQFASQNFDASLEQIITPLICGASIYLRDDEVWTTEKFWEVILNNKINMINLPPAFWRQVLADVKIKNAKEYIEKLRLLILGGDVVDQNLVEEDDLKESDMTIINAYGPTETTITAICYKVPKYDFKSGIKRSIPIGKPANNRNVYIADEFGNKLPSGMPGEIYIGGEQIARGYLGHPDITAEKFIPDDTGDCIPGSRIYKTGDWGIYDKNGNIIFLGRVDDQVKIRGIRIEPEEVSSAISGHPSVQKACVTAFKFKQNETRLAAYLEMKPGAELNKKEIISYLRKHIPEFMIPASITIMKNLPLSAGGKIDKRALPDPYKDNIVNEKLKPQTKTEKEIAEIIIQVLETNDVGVDENIFELGAHSLLLTKIISRINKQYGIELPINKLFEHPNISEVAALIEQYSVPKNEKSFFNILEEIENTPE